MEKITEQGASYFSPNMVGAVKIKGDEMDRACPTHEKGEKCIQNCSQKS
jgi:hypothetical protein